MSGSTLKSGRYLLDSNIVIAVFSNQIDLQRRRIQGVEIFLSTTLLGELFFGAEKSQRVRENIDRVEAFASAFPVLPCDPTTARHYGFLKNHVRRKGRPIPDNDLWIAALARQHGLILATRDRHFQDLEDVSTESWQSE